MRKSIVLSILTIILLGSKAIQATNETVIETASLVSQTQQVEEGEEIKVRLEISGMEVAAMQAQITFDTNKVEYISGPENSHNLGNRIRFVWYDEKGGLSPKKEGELGVFLFRAKQKGEAKFHLEAEFWNSAEQKMEPVLNDLTLSIREKREEIQNSTYLQVLRINEEGMTPYFEKEITEYYFIAEENIQNLEVTAIPESKEAEVTISGNTNLQRGINTITIVVSLKGDTRTYQIHVTKTEKKEGANTNLETLAIENAMLYPSFDNNITHYKIFIDNDIEKLKILAIPESEKAEVQIEGNENLKIGDNIIRIIVKAEDKITTKSYFIQAHRRTIQEQEEAEKEQKIQAEKLSILLEEQEKREEERNGKEQLSEISKDNSGRILLGVVVFLLLLSFGIWYGKKRRKK